MSVTANDRLKGMLGLAKKAGRIISGTGLVCDAVRKGKVCQVYIACDVSDNTSKRLTNCCAYYETPCAVIPVSGSELGHTIGKKSIQAAAAVTDPGFTAAINKLISFVNNSECCKADAISAGGAVNDTESEVQNQ